MDFDGISGSFRLFKQGFSGFHETFISLLYHAHKLLGGSGDYGLSGFQVFVRNFKVSVRGGNFGGVEKISGTF